MTTGDTPNTVAAGRAKRRNYLVSRKFQLRVAAWIALDVFAVCFVGGVLLLNVVEPQVRAQIVNPRVASSPMVTLVGFSLGFAAIAALAFGAWSVVFTHRICGPLTVVQRGLELLSRGEIPRFRPLRRKDEFRDFYAAYWRMVHALRARRQSRATSLKSILEAAEAGVQTGDSAARTRFERIVKETRALIEEAQRGEPAKPVSSASAGKSAPAAFSFNAAD